MADDNKIWQIALDFFYRFGPAGLFFIFAFYRLNQLFESESLSRESLIFQVFVPGLLGIAALIFSEFFKGVLQPIGERFRQPTINFIASKIELTYLRLTSRFQREYYSYLIDAHHHYRTQGIERIGAVDLGLERMFIPLGVVTQAYDQIPPKLIQVAEDAGNFTIWDFITASEDEPSYKRIALIAPPGSGKTILLKHLTLTYAKNEQRNQNRRALRLIP
ncbi:MAG: hypothetical protein AAFY26_21930, partial [Cyanobacteria bacterium J06638_22]